MVKQSVDRGFKKGSAELLVLSLVESMPVTATKSGS